MDDRNTEKMAVYYGNAANPESMTNLVYENKSITNPNYKEAINFITFDKPQIVYFGFKAESDKNKNWLLVDDIEMYKASDTQIDLVADTITLPFEFVRTPNDKNVSFTVQNVGLKNVIANLKVSIDGTLATSQPVTLKAQEIKSLTAVNVLGGLTPGFHTIKTEILCDNDENPENNSKEKQVYVLGEPAFYYNFEDNAIPKDFTFYTEDDGTINPNAGEEWNEEGWGIVSLGATHSMYGNSVFGGTSYIDFKESSHADRWVVLPRMKISGDDCYLVWDASSYNEDHKETYSIKVSDGSPNPADWWYTTMKTVYEENITPTTRGINLSDKFKGKDVYVAFNLTSASGDFLVLDNIGLYGDIISGVDNIQTDADANIEISGDKLIASGAKSITLSDANGRLLFNVKGNSADITSLPAGVYIATYLTDKGIKSAKFVK